MNQLETKLAPGAGATGEPDGSLEEYALAAVDSLRKRKQAVPKKQVAKAKAAALTIPGCNGKPKAVDISKKITQDATPTVTDRRV